uniref:A-kinase anchoring protein 6 n=1 Tax=Geospiza parvula TaxID=87175 RepID=A0A8C3NCY9_GEOPR
MDVALSPMRTQDLDPMPSDASPMLINMTPTVEQEGEGDVMKDLDSGQQYEKPPPLHTGADWKIVLHLPEIETWLRMTSERVRDLTYSVQQDSDSKHVDVHLVQLKDICEDISDHVEQIHALLETEFSLKLLSYSVNVIVDIHTVQLLWHQLRVSVLVLRERILQGLQDANGNYTRQTDILQAFSEETKEDRLDSLTEVDDSGQLTIKCSQNYLSLDCGITAFELSDYSPSEDLLGALDDMTSSQGKAKSFESWNYSEMDKEFPGLIRSVGLLAVATDSIASQCNEALKEKENHVPLSAEDGEETKDKKASHDLSLASPSGNSSLSKEPFSENGVLPTNSKAVSISKNPECNPPQHTGENIKHSHCENSTPKRSIRDCFNYNEDSPTQPTLPKRGLFLKDDVFKEYMEANDLKRQISQIVKNEMSRSTPSLLDPPDRSKLCLALQPPYTNSLSAVSQSYDCLNTISDKNLEYTINNHFKDSPIILGKCTFYNSKEKSKHKSHDSPEKEKTDRTPGSMCKTAPSTQVKKRGCSLQNGITSHSSKSLEETETDSSASSDSCNQRDPNGQSQGKTEPFSSPVCSQNSASSAGSELSSSSPLLLRRKKNKSLSSTPHYTQKTTKDNEIWYGSDEYLALPSHLKQTEVLALKLENLTKLLPQKPRRETIQNIDDWELSEMNSDSEMYPTYQTKKHKKRGRISPSSSSDIVSSLGDSIESGPLSDILSDEDLGMPVSCIKKYIEEKSERTAATQPTGNETSPSNKSALIHQLMQDIQHQENYETIWEKIEGFVSKLDEFIRWLNEAMETTENWTPPKAETDSLKLYLETHLSFKLNVDSHCALKEAVVEEGRQLLELIVSHKSGLKDMLQMIASQWKELQRQIKRQHSWILRALDIIKAEVLATDVSAENEEGTGSPKAEVQLCYLEAQRDAVEQMSLKLYSEQYNSSSKRKEEFADMSKVHTVGSNGLLDFDSEYQELWDWLIDMESIVMDSHDLMMSEEQQQHLYKEPLNVIDPSLMDLNGPSEDALEWDETDISNKLISIHEDLSDPDQELNKDDLNQKPASEDCGDNDVNEDESISNHGIPLYCPNITSPPNPHIYQVYSLHNIELSEKKHMPFLKKTSRLSSVMQSNILNKSLSKDSSFSSTKSLPDLIGGTTLAKPYNCMYQSGNISRHSESESGIVSECDTETTNNSEIFLLNDIESSQSNPEIGHVEIQVDNVIKPKLKQDEEDHTSLSDDCQLAPSVCCGSENDEDLDSIPMSNPACPEQLQGKHDVFTFYDYSYLQGSRFKLPVIMKQSQIEKTHTESSLFHDFCFDKIPGKSEHKSGESQPDGFIHDHTLASICGESDPSSGKSAESVKKLPVTENTRQVPTLSHSSSLESLSVVGDLFSSGIFKSGDGLQRSASLESWLTSYKSNEDLFSHHGSGDISASSDSVGELSKRTLDLLNRLENIQSPSDQKIKRSISDMTLQSSSQKMSFTGQLSLDIASSINEDSAASLTELSSSEDLSLCSEDIVLHRNKMPDSNASFRKHLNRSVADESDVNVSMIVNVSCTSACTDDEDDSDLLSSSTLTLTEEELGIKDEDDDSSIATDEDIYEECNLISGLDYIKNELQTWIRPKFSLTREKRKSNLSDEIQRSKEVSNETSKATDTLSIETLLNGSVQKISENNGNSKNIPCDRGKGTKSHPVKDISQVVKDQLVDDMENGNVENTLGSQKEGLVSVAATPKTHASLDVREAENECGVCEAFTDSSDDSHMDGKETVLSSAGSRNPPRECQSHLQPDHHSVASSPAKKPCLESSSEINSVGIQDTALQPSLSSGQQHRINATEKFPDCCAALKSSEKECNSSANGFDLCCNCESADFDKKPMEDGSVHNFVREIIDMASTALKSKSQPECESSAPASLAQIKEKVLEHSHRPIQLRKGDFYSYLSLSSHDSDCGEVIKYIEEKSSTPVPLDFTDEREDIECFFEACPEEEWVEQQQQSISNGSPEAQVEQQQPISNPISETSAESLGEVTPESLELKTSSEGRDLSFLCGDDNDINIPNTNKKCTSSNSKNADDDLLFSDGRNESLEKNSPEVSTKKSSAGKSPGTEDKKGCVAASEEASATEFQIKPGHSQKKDGLHQNRKTLTCEENLLKLHKERHINMHR